MTYGIQFEQRDILIVPMPFTNLQSVKQRPVLVISKDNSSDDIIVCGITSNLKDSVNSILIDISNLENGSVPKTSRIKVDKLFTIEKTIIRKKIGKIDNNTMKQVKQIFLELI